MRSSGQTEAKPNKGAQLEPCCARKAIERGFGDRIPGNLEVIQKRGEESGAVPFARALSERAGVLMVIDARCTMATVWLPGRP